MSSDKGYETLTELQRRITTKKIIDQRYCKDENDWTVYSRSDGTLESEQRYIVVKLWDTPRSSNENMRIYEITLD